MVVSAPGERWVRRYGHGAFLVIGAGGFDGSVRLDRYSPPPRPDCPACIRRTSSGVGLCSVHRDSIERTFVEGPRDMSPRAIGYQGNQGPHETATTDEREAWRTYDSRCGWCWLGHPHSTASHDRRIAIPIVQDDEAALRRAIEAETSD